MQVACANWAKLQSFQTRDCPCGAALEAGLEVRVRPFLVNANLIFAGAGGAAATNAPPPPAPASARLTYST